MKREIMMLISLMLIIGPVFMGGDTGTNSDTDVNESDELAKKTYISEQDKWVFDVGRIYHYFINYEDEDDDPKWVEEASGNYLLNTGSKTVTLVPKRCLGDNDTLLVRTEYLAEMQEEYADSTDEDAQFWSDGKYKTIEEYINGKVNEAFSQQTYNYVLIDNKITNLQKQ
jgi:hypothetical protein